eukprot:694793-Pleurochrysis_carterae.AAC.2
MFKEAQKCAVVARDELLSFDRHNCHSAGWLGAPLEKIGLGSEVGRPSMPPPLSAPWALKGWIVRARQSLAHLPP